MDHSPAYDRARGNVSQDLWMEKVHDPIASDETPEMLPTDTDDIIE